MVEFDPAIIVHRSVAETLTVDAMVLIDEVETYFGDMEGPIGALSPEVQTTVVRAGLRVMTRLTRLIDYLIQHDARAELPPERFTEGGLPEVDPAKLPPQARALIDAAQVLFERVDGLGDAGRGMVAVESPARMLQERVERSFARKG